jgi:hypothetical protein
MTVEMFVFFCAAGAAALGPLFLLGDWLVGLGDRRPKARRRD